MKKFNTLFILLLISSISFAQTKWDGVTITPVTPVKKVYTITNGAELAWIAQQCKDTVTNFYTELILIAENIDLDNHEWTPIGTEYNPFKGAIQGNWKTISNIKVSITGSNNGDYVGLLGFAQGDLTRQVHVANLFLENVNITGNKAVGGMVGYAKYFVFDSCYVEQGTVVGNTAVGGFLGHGSYTACSDCYAKVNVTANEMYGGGFVGINDTTDNRLIISYCYSRGAVNGSKDNQDNNVGINGGFVGLNHGKVKSAYMVSNPITGNITGNFCGINGKTGRFDNCYYCSSYYPSLGGMGHDSSAIGEEDMIPQPVGQMTSEGFVGTGGGSGLNASDFTNPHWSMDFKIQPPINEKFPIHLWQYHFLYDSTANIGSVLPASLSIYPNPVRNVLYIEIKNIKVQKVEIVDLLGKPIISRKSNYEIIEMNQFNNGIYFVKIYTQDDIITRKFIKQ